MIFGAVALLSGSFALVIEMLHRAPIGYQDETGFHYSEQSRSARDVSPTDLQSLPEPSRRAA